MLYPHADVTISATVNYEICRREKKKTNFKIEFFDCEEQ